MKHIFWKRRFVVSKTVFWTMAMLLLCACNTPKNVVYLQNAQEHAEIDLSPSRPQTVQSGDQLIIRIHSYDQELANVFNIDQFNTQKTSRYTVDSKGQIDFPNLGVLDVASHTREEIANMIKYRLIASKMVPDPIVIVDFQNLGVSVLGEVNQPGWKEIDKDYITVIEAIAKSGDLTINGQRDNILVMRKMGNKEVSYKIDLTDVERLYASEAYYLKSGDLVYVQPNKTRAYQSTPNGNTFFTPAFWVSMGSFAMTVAIFFLK